MTSKNYQVGYEYLRVQPLVASEHTCTSRSSSTNLARQILPPLHWSPARQMSPSGLGDADRSLGFKFNRPRRSNTTQLPMVNPVFRIGLRLHEHVHRAGELERGAGRAAYGSEGGRQDGERSKGRGLDLGQARPVLCKRKSPQPDMWAERVT